MFLLGVLCGAIIATVAILGFFFFEDRSGSVIFIDKFWLENEDRWNWLRIYELEVREKGDKLIG